MIVIKATGAPDVKQLKKLARSLGAQDGDVSIEDPTPTQTARLARKAGKPTVSTLPGTIISARTQDAIDRLQPVEIERAGEYELS
ncbi:MULTISPECIES: hypothetical protein [unclassified Aminobacter]|uniref:hypothetical protein n=1 Tax=unclassified Aminobacter TaxID=2644704 RepID=UPI00046686B9|nr:MULTISPECIES: hypothetical protein [unclassified Aminobacter]TWH36656.1 hypothetical protein L611_000100001380 [Aminobacter sp. J15]